jgi:hypothetical protein
MNNQNREDYVDFNDQEYESEGFEDQAFGEEAYQDPGYDEPGLADDNYDDEDFPEPGGAPAAGEKKKMGPAMMAGAGALAVVLVLGAGYYFMGGGEEGAEGGFAMPDIVGMVTGNADPEVPAEEFVEGEDAPPEGEAAPPPPKPKPKAQKPAAKPQAAKPAGKPAAKPNDGWSDPVAVTKKAAPPATKPKPAPVAAKPKPKPPAAKPQPRPAVAAAPGGAQGASAHTTLTFAPGSYWVASAEMERLWSFSSGLKTNAGRITVEAHPGTEANAAELVRKRADRVAELIKKNNVGNRFDVNVKIGKPAAGAGRVDVYYSRAL